MTKVGVIIGRFQPLHDGHVHLIKEAESQCDHLIILVGSANQCRSIKNPWNYVERGIKIHNVLNSLNITSASVHPLNDYLYNDLQWKADVITTVENFAGTGVEITFFGHNKVGNNYLSWFPQWNYVNIESDIDISGTQVRNALFEAASDEVPKSVLADYAYYKKESETFKNYPYPDTLNFNCGDVVLECAGQILLIKRKFAPGAGTWALPGGFKNSNETFEQCAIRELFEETNLRVPEKVILGSIVSSKLFDSPLRSFGIPRNTLAVYIRISPNPDGTLPRANGSDDASDVRWEPINSVLNVLPLYDDHAEIVSSLTGVKPLSAFNRTFH